MHAVEEWNKLGSVLIQEDQNLTINDLIIEDCYNINDTAGETKYYGLKVKIKLNTYLLDNVTYEQRCHTILHEFGHALKLDEFTNLEAKNNVMLQGKLNYMKLGPADIAVYRYLWG